MKNIILYMSFAWSLNCLAQTPSIKFSYSQSGHQEKRFVQVVNLRIGNTPKPKDSTLVFKVYPNPTSDNITIEGPLGNGTTEAKIELYDIKGSLVQQDVYNGIKKTYSLAGHRSGIYFLEIKYTNKQSSNYRIVITE